MRKFLFVVIGLLIACPQSFAQQPDDEMPPVSVMTGEGKIALALAGENARAIYESLKVKEHVGGGQSFKGGKNISCHKFSDEYVCFLPYSEKGEALDPKELR